jgi:Flp pilus assembly protein TadG
MLARHAQSRRRGAAIAEFAVVVPVLFMIVIGIIEVGRLVMVAQLASTASREAARYAVQAKTSAADADAFARAYLQQAGIPDSAVTSLMFEAQTTGGGWVAAADPSALQPGTPVRAKLSIDYAKVAWLPSRFFLPEGTSVRGVTVMRKE